jgi:hypothetical protein
LWTKPNKKQATRVYPAPQENVIALGSIIMWFVMGGDTQFKFNLPDHVVAKLEKYSFCLFGPVDYEILSE